MTHGRDMLLEAELPHTRPPAAQSRMPAARPLRLRLLFIVDVLQLTRPPAARPPAARLIRTPLICVRLGGWTARLSCERLGGWTGLAGSLLAMTAAAAAGAGAAIDVADITSGDLHQSPGCSEWVLRGFIEIALLRTTGKHPRQPSSSVSSTS